MNHSLFTRDGPIIIQTHRDSDISSLASRPHDTDLNIAEKKISFKNKEIFLDFTPHDGLSEPLQVLPIV